MQCLHAFPTLCYYLACRMSHDSQEAATAPDEAETDDELDTPGPLGTAGDAAADSLSQQLVVITSEDGSEHRYQGQQHWDGQTSANSTPGSSNSSVNSGMHLWESAQPLLLKYVAPALVLLVSLRWLLRKLQRRDTPGSIQHDQPAPEAVEPEPTLAVYASDFVLEPPPTNSPRAAFLEGLRCVAAEHVAVQVRWGGACREAGCNWGKWRLVVLHTSGFMHAWRWWWHLALREEVEAS